MRRGGETGWLGHADAGFTLKVYIHLMDGGMGDAVKVGNITPGRGRKRRTGGTRSNGLIGRKHGPAAKDRNAPRI
jgi:hypothetical protein